MGGRREKKKKKKNQRHDRKESFREREGRKTLSFKEEKGGDSREGETPSRHVEGSVALRERKKEKTWAGRNRLKLQSKDEVLNNVGKRRVVLRESGFTI